MNDTFTAISRRQVAQSIAAADSSYERRDVSAEHEDILDAAVHHDADAACAFLLSHYRLTGAYLTNQLSGL